MYNKLQTKNLTKTVKLTISYMLIRKSPSRGHENDMTSLTDSGSEFQVLAARIIIEKFIIKINSRE